MLSKKELKYYAVMAAESFADDPVYTACIKNRFFRKRLLYNFMYLRLNASNLTAEDIMIEDAQKRGLCVWKKASNGLTKKEIFACSKWLNLIFYAAPLSKMMRAFADADMSVFEGNTLLLSPIFVDKKYQGRGVAKALVSDSARELSAKGFRLGLETQNKNNILIYNKMGFELVKNEKYLNGKITNYFMIYNPNFNSVG